MEAAFPPPKLLVSHPLNSYLIDTIPDSMSGMVFSYAGLRPTAAALFDRRIPGALCGLSVWHGDCKLSMGRVDYRMNRIEPQASLENEIVALGEDIWHRMAERVPGSFRKDRWTDRLLNWAMEDTDL